MIKLQLYLDLDYPKSCTKNVPLVDRPSLSSNEEFFDMLIFDEMKDVQSECSQNVIFSKTMQTK